MIGRIDTVTSTWSGTSSKRFSSESPLLFEGGMINRMLEICPAEPGVSPLTPMRDIGSSFTFASTFASASVKACS